MRITKRADSFSQKRGFTLVELLVVIAIIGILIALLLPAIQAAREAARRMECSDHLGQMAKAALNHEDSWKFFPSGGWSWKWMADPNCGYGRGQPGCWTFNILPWIEMKSLHDTAMGLGGATKQIALKAMTESVVPVYYCPSRRQAILYWCSPSEQVNCTGLTKSGKSDYGGNAGTLQSASGRWFNPTGNDAVGASGGKYPNVDDPSSGDYMNGIIFSTSTVKIKQIRDGCAHTYLFGEKLMPVIHYTDGKDGNDNTALFSGCDYDFEIWSGLGGTVYQPDESTWSPTERTNRSQYRPTKDPRDKTPNSYPPNNDPNYQTAGISIPNRATFGSAHPSSFNAAFCDGSVRSIRYDVSLRTHYLLGRRDDGTAVDANDY